MLLGCSVMAKANIGRGAVPAPWERERGVDAVLDRWLESRIVQPCFTADETLPGRSAKMAPFPAKLPTQLAFALRGRGVAELYEHQARAFEAAYQGPGSTTARGGDRIRGCDGARGTRRRP